MTVFAYGLYFNRTILIDSKALIVALPLLAAEILIASAEHFELDLTYLSAQSTMTTYIMNIHNIYPPCPYLVLVLTGEWKDIQALYLIHDF